MTDTPAPRSRPATIAFLSAAVLQPGLFLVRVLAQPDIDVDAPPWLAYLTVTAAVIAGATIALGVLGYIQTREAGRSGFTRAGVSVVLSFFFGLMALIELFNGTTVLVD